MLDVVLDLCDVVSVLKGLLMGREVAVSDRVIVSRPGLVNMLGRQRRRERQEWREEEQSCDSSESNDHRCLRRVLWSPTLAALASTLNSCVS